MVRINSLLGRSVAVFVSAALAVTSSAEGVAFGFETLRDLIQEVVRIDPPAYTDAPTEWRPIADARRDERKRGGLWSEVALKELADLKARLADEKPQAGPAARPPKDGVGGQPDPATGAPFEWEQGFGWIEARDYFSFVNSNTGRVLTALPLVSLNGRGLGIDLTLYHNSVTGTNTEIGTGWSWSYDISLWETETIIYVKWPDGKSIPYTIGQSGFTPPPGIEDRLENYGGTYYVTTPEGVMYIFNTDGLLTRIEDRNANAIQINRISGKISSIDDPNGRRLSVSRDSEGKISAFIDWSGRQWGLVRTNSQLTSVSFPNPGGTPPTETFEYGQFGITKRIDKRGNQATFGFDAYGRATWYRNHLNHQWSTLYETSATSLYDPSNNHVRHVYSGGMIATSVDEAGYSQQYVWTADRKVATLTDQRGFDWTFTYDSTGNVLTMANPYGHTWTNTYNAQNDLLTSKNPLNQTTTYAYDANGNLVSVTDPLGRVVAAFSHGSHGVLVSSTNALGGVSTYTNDSYGRPVSVVDPNGLTASIAYDSLDRPVSVTGPSGTTSQFEYDVFDRVVRATNPGGSFSTTNFDHSSNVTRVTDELGRQTNFTYNALDRVLTSTNAKSEVEQFQWNNLGELTKITNAKGGEIRYEYTPRGEIRKIFAPDNSVETWSYNGTGHTSAYVNGVGETTYYLYNLAGQNYKIDYPTGTDTNLYYNIAGRFRKFVDATGTTEGFFNAAGETTALNTPQGNMSYTNNLALRRSTMTEPGLGTTTTEFDLGGRPTTHTNAFGEVFGFQYDTAGRLFKATRPGGYTEYGYDSRDRVSSIVHKTATNSVVSSEAYSWSVVGNLNSKTVDGVTTTYGYDAIDQMTAELRPGFNATYTYDSNGNRLTKTLNGFTETYDYDIGDKLLSVTGPGLSKIYSYDAAGRTTAIDHNGAVSTFVYDCDSRIVSSSGLAGYALNTYNGLGARVGRSDASGVFNYKRNGASPTSPVLSDGVVSYTPGLSEKRGGTSRFVGSDYLGTHSKMLDGAGQVATSRQYDAFGVPTSGSDPSPFGFAGSWGYQEDAGGLKLLGHRYYDPSTGRFLTRDPIKDGRNWYAYCGNNPTVAVDPTGLVSREAFQTALDVVGIFDPFGVADLVNGAIHVAYGEYALAGISFAGMIPYAGDLAKFAKLGRYRKLRAPLKAARSVAKSAGISRKMIAVGPDVTDAIMQQPGFYIIYKKGSNKPYIGQTGRDFFTRLSEHKRKGEFDFKDLDIAVFVEYRGTKLQRELLEQRGLDKLGGKLKTDNRRNPIGPHRRM